MPGGGAIRIRWRKDARNVLLRFADKGEGMVPEDLPKVFQPYFTTKNTGTCSA